MSSPFPPRQDGRLYLTEAGIETEVMYKLGYELPHFAMYPYLDDQQAVADFKAVWRRQIAVAADHGMVPLMAGLDYRASQDWAALLGHDERTLRDYQRRCIAFLRELFEEAADRVPRAYAVGGVGPRGDAYGTGHSMTDGEAEDYHGAQIESLKDAGADMAWAMTFSAISEAIGAIRAAAAAGLPVALSFTLNSDSRLSSGPSLREAIETVDAETGTAASFYGINCSHPLEFEPALDGGSWEKRIRCIRPNASPMEKIALCKLGHLEDGNPRELGHQMAAVAEKMPWMDIFGGCCGTDERHLAEIAKAVRMVKSEQDDLFDDVPV